VNSQFIKIADLYAEGRELFVSLKVSEAIRKYFFKNEFKIEYDVNIENVDKSILTIPALSMLAPMAWSSNADIFVDRVDKTYLDSLSSIRKILEVWYPQLVSQSQIKFNKIVSNHYHNGNGALFFSGGIDSLASYLRNKADHPILITLLMDNDRYAAFYEKLKNILNMFSKDLGNDIHFIKADIWNGTNGTINNMQIAKDSGLPVWWRLVSLGLTTVGLSAPLTAAAGIGFLRLANTYNHSQMRADGSYYFALTKFGWADIHLVYDSTDLTRQQKIRQFFRGNHENYGKYLLVCNDNSRRDSIESSFYPRNCGHCEKCMRTITGLILEGIDPNECNFRVKDGILMDIKRVFLTRSINLPSDIKIFWRDIQEHVDSSVDFSNVVGTKYSARDFFEWFQTFNLESYQPNRYNHLKREFSSSLKYEGLNYALSRAVTYAVKNSRNRFHHSASKQPNQYHKTDLPSNEIMHQ
jgi:hypothetical protein